MYVPGYLGAASRKGIIRWERNASVGEVFANDKRSGDYMSYGLVGEPNHMIVDRNATIYVSDGIPAKTEVKQLRGLSLLAVSV